MTPLLHDGPKRSKLTVVLAHGAGAPMDSPFMRDVAEGLAAHGLHVVRFEFPYMHARRSGSKPGPDRMPVLLETWREVVHALGGGSTLVIGGKSMGGRAASLVADELGVAGLVCFGYPFHPSAKPESLRVDHLRTLKTPTRIIQGTRDALGNRAEVEGYALPKRIELRWIEDGDHSLAPRKSSGRTVREALDEAIALAAELVTRVSA